jgi:hypothetical protein
MVLQRDVEIVGKIIRSLCSGKTHYTSRDMHENHFDVYFSIFRDNNIIVLNAINNMSAANTRFFKCSFQIMQCIAFSMIKEVNCVKHRSSIWSEYKINYQAQPQLWLAV